MSKPRERVKKILDWEELERAPNTHGALSFLKSAAEIVSIRKNDAIKTPAPSNPTPGVRKLSATKHRPNPKPCFLAQDGHSLGEAALYQVLWSRARPDTDDSRIITAGWRTMKRFCGMTDKNCKRNATGLVEKLAIEVIGAENISTFTGRTYRIHSYATILARRKAAGLEWVSRDRSRRFVQKDGSPLTSSNLPESYPTTGAELSGSNPTPGAELHRTNPTPGVSTTIGAVVAKTPGAGVATTTPLVSLLGSIEEEVPSTTTEVDLVVQALAEQAGVADAGAANRLISECRSACPSATTSEIVGIVQEKAFAARSRRDVRNLIGFLLSTVPPVFERQGIVSYRRMIAAEAEAAKRKAEQQQKDREEMRAYFVRQAEHLQDLLSQPGLPEKKRNELEGRLREYQDMLKQHGEDAVEQTGSTA